MDLRLRVQTEEKFRVPQFCVAPAQLWRNIRDTTSQRETLKCEDILSDKLHLTRLLVTANRSRVRILHGQRYEQYAVGSIFWSSEALPEGRKRSGPCRKLPSPSVITLQNLVALRCVLYHVAVCCSSDFRGGMRTWVTRLFIVTIGLGQNCFL